jgi:hypothetical protein
MANAQQTPFPNLQTIMDLARAYVLDSYPGVGGTTGRVLTNAAPFTLPFVNSALRVVARLLRNEGVTFPIKDNVILSNVLAVPGSPRPDIQIYVGFDGFFDGVAMHATPKLPSDCLQVFDVSEQIAGSNLPFVPMVQPEDGLPSSFQAQWLGVWEWRQYRIYMVGSQNNENIRIRYQSGQPPINAAPDKFDQVEIQILDCEEAVASEIARQYGQARSGMSEGVAAMAQQRDSYIGDMANEWVRRAQGVNYRREAYESAGSNNSGTPLTPTSATGSV